MNGWLTACLSLWLLARLVGSLPIYLSIFLSVCLSVCPPVRPSVRPSVCLSLCLSGLSENGTMCTLRVAQLGCLGTCIFTSNFAAPTNLGPIDVGAAHMPVGSDERLPHTHAWGKPRENNMTSSLYIDAVTSPGLTLTGFDPTMICL